MFARNCLQLATRRSFVTNTRRQVLKSSILPSGLVWTVSLLGASAFYFYAMNSRSAIHEYVICPIFRLITPDPEDGHNLGIWCLKWKLAPRLFFDNDPESLHIDVFGKKLSNPIGCAAGLDKNAEAIDGIMPGGFGYMEVGTVTPLPQPGNPKPRFFRLPLDEAVINRYGFNSGGHDTVYENLSKRVKSYMSSYFTDKKAVENLSLYKNKLLAVNLGKNKTGDEFADYLKGVEKFQSLADALVINVSSPNTPGLRDLQAESKLTTLLSQIVTKRDSLVGQGNALGQNSHKPPILVKIAPDLNDEALKSVVESAKNSQIDGIVVSNTTIQRPDTLITQNESLKNQTGGLSGKPLKPLSLKALKNVAKYAKGSNLVLVGCGGISTGKDALEFGKAGASFVQLYTAYAYRGPGLVAKIKDELADELKKENKTWTQIIGEDVK
ncbi:ZYRO0C08998p [Zygosaccharomyces rouxii]|uniref:Dihydroorotate dehydrogenase (quinone), mitochondrial n=1 Tax=Zygosaccharomyces rouxii (strain ATCC 2623 / CBS 732 / NBRC 1130 / NCYC 568 / NRRL Y-229) TaxID=559307 RepID=C5DTJ2_ZYGRC|nr:uncharacterized protein ZYRO0C08998g [Zygosaccharomyces rouxii]KAH9201718.1 Dihydroorotate dehydrogenase-domain-containing protein [Zygosaccharomyces rouxii]CAR27103.1 ZYRO0C08998p [Zygosaccharomyces rouxii]